MTPHAVTPLEHAKNVGWTRCRLPKGTNLLQKMNPQALNTQNRKALLERHTAKVST